MSIKPIFDKIQGKLRESDRLPPNFLYQNTQVVQTLADFPAPIGRFIYLEDKVYIIDAIKLDITGYTIVFGRRSAIKGFNQNVSSFQSFEAGALLFKGGANIFMNEIEVFCSANNQQVFECISNGTVPDGTSFEINLFAAYCLDANDNFTTGCKVGFIKDIRQGFIGTMFFFGFDNGFELAGYWVDGGWRVENTLFRAFDMMNTGGKCFYSSPTDPVTFEARFASNANIQINGNSIGYDFPETAFTYDGQYQIQNGNASGTGTFVANFASGFPAYSARSNFDGNTGIQNTFPGGEWITTANTTIAVATQNVFYDIVVPTTERDLAWFSETDGQFEYLSTTPLDVQITLTVTLTGTSNNLIEVQLIKESSAMVITPLLVRLITLQGTLQQGRAESAVITTTTQLVFGDKIRARGRNTSSAQNFTVSLDSNCIINAK